MKRIILAAAAVLALSACATTGSVRLNTNRAFLTGQVALKSAQQTTFALCTVPSRPAALCDKAIDLLHQGSLAENAGFTAQQSGNAKDLATATQTLVALPAQLVALGILKAN